MTSTIDVLNNIINGQPIEKQRYADQFPAELLQEATAKKAEFRSKLQRGVWTVEFTKVDGTPAVMECTLDGRYMPPGEEMQDSGTKAADNPTVLRVFAVDRDGWRSFRVLSVTKFYPKDEAL